MVSVLRAEYRPRRRSISWPAVSVLVVSALAGCVQNPYSLGSNREDAIASGGSGGLFGASGGSGGAPLGKAGQGGVSCDGATCVISCGAGECLDPISCPPGAACHVICGDDACAGGISCAPDAPCQIDCLGERACGPLDCNASSTCAVNCTGANSCQAAIDGNSGSTQLTCGVAACGGPIHLSAGDVAIHCQGDSSCAGPVECEGVSCSLDCAQDATCGSVCCRAERCTLPDQLVNTCP